jgi:hypothetical protein
MTRAIVHSIHSQVPETIAGFNRRFDTILSLDSHLDVSLGGDYGVYPEELRIFAQRTGVHSVLRDISGGIPSLRDQSLSRRPRTEVIVAIPERMLARHASDIELGLPPSLRLGDLKESISSVVDFLRTTIGIEVYPSPPKSLMGLAPRTRSSRTWLLDVDVDYMREMQDECYTQIRNTAPGVLQSMSDVIRFVKHSKPKIITISEVRVSAIRDKGSTFSGFLGALSEIGYSVEEHGVYRTDSEVLKGISVCKEFYRKVSRPLMMDQMDAMMRGELGGFEEKEKATARDFFRSKGYAM